MTKFPDAPASARLLVVVPDTHEESDPPPTPAAEPTSQRFVRWSKASAWLAIVVSSLIFASGSLGWFLRMDLWALMQPRTLVCAVAAGVTLHLWHSHRALLLGRWLAAMITFAGLLAVAYYVAACEVADPDRLTRGGALVDLLSRGRLSLPSSVIVACLGLALWGLHADRSPRWTEGFSLAGGALASLAIIGHLYHAEELFAPFSLRGIALLPSVLLALVSAGALFARPSVGWVSLLATDRPAGPVARGLLGPTLLAPTLLGATSLAGERAGLFDHQISMALVAVGTAAVLAWLIVKHAGALLALDGRVEELQSRLVQAHRIDATTDLAGWMCHEFNNLLTAIEGYSSLILEQDASPGVHENVREVLAAAEECAGLTRKLLRYSGHERQAVEPVDLADVVSGLSQTVESIVGRATQITLLLEPGTLVCASRAQLEHVVRQLVLNARDAMPDGGQLILRVDRGTGAPASAARLLVSDTGTGMTPEVRARALEPFFTTKPRGRGTGLGLATVYGIVKRLGGVLEIRSAENAGTTITISIPGVESGSRVGGASQKVDDR